MTTRSTHFVVLAQKGARGIGECAPLAKLSEDDIPNLPMMIELVLQRIAKRPFPRSAREVFQLVRDAVIHVRRRQGAPGFTVGATRLNDENPSWQTEVAAPVRGVRVQGDTATAVTINVGAVRPSEQGFITVYPCGEERPLASSINYRGGDVISNSVLAKIGEDGKVCIYTLRETDFIADVTGFVAPVTPVVTMPG